ncbi:hypothetical protein FMUBM48_22040 [Nocardia cyriacigeorgica]|nr:hypothetical protein FMUBM48_22040 [Nocardia cyriacigeorgica]
MAMNMIRPPNRSVSAPTAIRPSEPTRIGVATSIDVSVLLSDRSPAYVVESGPIMFQAQKLIADTQVASARFDPRCLPRSVTETVTVPGNHAGSGLAAFL